MLGTSFRQSQNDVGEFRLEKRNEIELRFDHIHPLSLLTIAGKSTKLVIKYFLNVNFTGGLLAVYQYGKNTCTGTFCGVEDEPFVEPDTVSFNL